MRLVVKAEELFELKNKLLEYISNIQSELQALENVKDKFVWEGQAYNAFVNKYDTIMTRTKKEVEILEKLITFLDEVISGFDQASDSISSVYNSIKEYKETYLKKETS